MKLCKDLIRDFWTFLSPNSSVEFINLEPVIVRNGIPVTVFVYFAMRVYFGWWQIGWSWMNGSFWQTERCFLFITKQKRSFDFGFSKNTFFSQAQIRYLTLLTPSHTTLKSSKVHGFNAQIRIIIFNLYSGLVPSEFNRVRYIPVILKVKIKF